MVQWLRIHLAGQGTLVRSLVQEDPTCCWTTQPKCHAIEPALWSPRATNIEAHAPQPLMPVCHGAHAMQQKKPLQQKRPPQQEACALQLESSPHSLQVEKALS